MKTDFFKYTCIALVAGFLVAGTPGQGYAIDFGNTGDLGVIDSILAFGAAYDAPVCGDRKGKDCTSEDDRRCVSKKGVKLCQTCTDGKWGSGHHSDCWDDDDKTVQAESAVLGVF